MFDKFRITKITDNVFFYKITFIAIVIIRLVLNAFLPLMDKTEARYAEIARIMHETNNWITPYIDYGVPFWAKPPLSTWLSALSMHLFGVNEFAVRLPYLLISLLIVLLIAKYAKRQSKQIYLVGCILFTLPEFFLHAGVVSTDTFLAFSVALVMLSFWEVINFNKKYWGYLFFVGIGLGLLAKGPIILVLTAPPIFLWLVWFNKFRVFFNKIPWLSGLLLLCTIVLPWYYLAEIKTPGFINYFIVGENFKRFFVSGWNGDKYGFAKKQPLGIIWLFLLLVTIPWIQMVLFKIIKLKWSVFKDKWSNFLILWLFWTPLFFTFSKSLIHTYTLPIMIPIALLIIYWWDNTYKNKQLFLISLILPILVAILFIVSIFYTDFENQYKTDKFLIENNLGTIDFDRFYYYGKKSYSSQFYSSGKVKIVNEDALMKLLDTLETAHLIIDKRDLKILSKIASTKIVLLQSNEYKNLYYLQN
jgi:4-amino-4-deoxy-L-arabinose transferase-like glycosyltransferase